MIVNYSVDTYQSIKGTVRVPDEKCKNSHTLDAIIIPEIMKQLNLNIYYRLEEESNDTNGSGN